VDRWQRGEAELALACVDDLARYVREHQEGMTREQVRLLQEDLADFERSYVVWKKREHHLTVEELDAGPWLDFQRARLDRAVKEGLP